MTMQIYYSTMVRRWHTNPHMSHTVDPVGYHSARMAVLALTLWPGRHDLVAGCLTHDLGECASGDIPWGGDKSTADEVADNWSVNVGLDHHLDLGPMDIRRLKFLDRLDAYLWARHHQPKMVKKEKAWQLQRDWLVCEADKLGVDVCQFNM